MIKNILMKIGVFSRTKSQEDLLAQLQITLLYIVTLQKYE